MEGAALIPLLILLAVMSPSSTAGPEVDTPKWLPAYLDYRTGLRELSEAATKVRIEVEASRGSSGKVETHPPRAPEIAVFEEGWGRAQGEPPWRPCNYKGHGGPGSSSPRPGDSWIQCRYQCGRYEVKFYIFSRRSEDCDNPKNLGRAEGLAKGAHR